MKSETGNYGADASESESKNTNACNAATRQKQNARDETSSNYRDGESDDSSESASKFKGRNSGDKTNVKTYEPQKPASSDIASEAQNE
jgi:hypothetical protein